MSYRTAPQSKSQRQQNRTSGHSAARLDLKSGLGEKEPHRSQHSATDKIIFKTDAFYLIVLHYVQQPGSTPPAKTGPGRQYDAEMTIILIP